MAGNGSHKRKKPNGRVTAARPSADELAELQFRFVCTECEAISNEWSSLYTPKQPVCPPEACPVCGHGEFLEQMSVRPLDPDSIGVQVRMRKRGTSRWTFHMVKRTQVYAETGERFFYERMFDRINDVYDKRYTNLETGEVAVQQRGPLSEHRGFGAARRATPDD